MFDVTESICVQAPEADGVPINSNQVAVQPGMPAVADLSGAAKNQSTSGQAQAAGQRALRPSVTFQADHQVLMPARWHEHLQVNGWWLVSSCCTID